MADGQVTNEQIVALANVIPVQTMVEIAEAHFGLEDGVIKNKEKDFPNAEAQSREMLKIWLYKNPDNQVQVK